MTRLPYSHLNLLKPTEAEAATCVKIVQSTTGLVARHLNKRFSLPISLFLSRRGFKPNNITFFNMGVGLISGLLAAFGTDSSILWGAFFFQLASVLDGVDGEVAKLTDRATQMGQWLDTLSDNLTLLVFLVGLTIGLYQTTHDFLILVAGEVALFSFFVLLAIMLLFLKKNTTSGSFVTYDREFVGKISQEKGFLPRFVKYGRYFLKKDSFALLFLLLAAIGQPQLIIYAVALGTTVGWLLMAYFNLKKGLAKTSVLSKVCLSRDEGN
ncbi:MAG: CDP-alcohol phosphatidyltransferase family protein [Deltaproteobacteria bacterium]|nr:CDP-alcohol phosphatidyltransferase family protein [Deltaproteobacteria bacterium]